MARRLDAYAAGVNAWLKDDDQQFGLELTLIKLCPAAATGLIRGGPPIRWCGPS